MGALHPAFGGGGGVGVGSGKLIQLLLLAQ